MTLAVFRALRGASSLLLGCLFALTALAVAPQSVGAQAPPSEYLIGPEDVLDVSVWKEEELQREVLVRPDGRVSFPLVGDVQAAGRTPTQVRDEIASKLRRYIPEPVVSVIVATVGGNKIYVIGQVQTPGAYVIGRYVDVVQALTVAGGMTEFAKENDVRIIRRQGGKFRVFDFRFGDLKKGKNLKDNIMLEGGDTVVVP
jgi:polysaccharide export outer membrane protein